MKDVELRIVAELVKDSRRTDRALARAIGVSQPTVSRVRTRLEKQGMIDYTAIPDLPNLGYQLMAVIMGRRNVRKYPDILQKAREFAKRHPEVIFGADGNGLGYDRIGISIHKNFSEYTRFMREFRNVFGNAMEVDSFLISLTSHGILQPLSLKRFAEQLIKK